MFMPRADARAMDTDIFEAAACAGADLTARLLAELSRLDGETAIATARVTAALATGQTPPNDAREARRECRRKAAVLHQLLDGMPYLTGESHAATA